MHFWRQAMIWWLFLNSPKKVKTKNVLAGKKDSFSAPWVFVWKETFSANAFCSRLHLSGNKNTRRRTSTLIFYSASRFNWSRLWFNLMGQITVCSWWGFIVPSHSNQTIADHQTTEGSGCFNVFSFPISYHNIKRRKLGIPTRPSQIIKLQRVLDALKYSLFPWHITK